MSDFGCRRARPAGRGSGRMRAMALLLTVGSVSASPSARAQVPDVLSPPARIRFSVPPDTSRVVASVLAQRGESLWVRPAHRSDTLVIARGRVAGLEVSRGKETHVLAGAGIGLLSGAAVGALVGAASGGSGCNPNPQYPGVNFGCIGPGDAGGAAVAGAVALGVLGAGVGALVGWLRPGERWEAVALPSAGGISLRENGHGYAVGLTFSLPHFR